MTRSILHAVAPAPPVLGAPKRILQRKCACEGTRSSGGECEQCGEERMQRRALGGPAARPAAGGVRDVLRAPGSPLDGQTRSFMESRFGHDFSTVRVHSDAAAAASARGVDAVAYTVGSHIVFGRTQYSPTSSAGRWLLAHELAHVVQQAGSGPQEAIQRASISLTADEEEVAPKDDPLEREAEEAADAVTGGGTARLAAGGRQALQRRTRLGHHDEGSEHLYYEAHEPKLERDRDKELADCVTGAGPAPRECTPSTALTWADFSGTPPAGQFSAWTEAPVKDVAMDPVRARCLQDIMSKSGDQTRVFQATFDAAKSWVRPKTANPTDPAVNGCAATVARCEKFFEGPAKKLADPHFDLKLPEGCPASIPYSSARALTKQECQSKLAAPCAAREPLESARVLKHEQGHFNIACAIARSANAALQAGGDMPAIRTAVGTKLRAAQKAYDNDSENGCKPAQQASWETDIAAGLPTVTIP